MLGPMNTRPTGSRIVVVSHESDFLHLMQTLLDTLGFGVRTTSDWHNAPRLVNHLRPDLVVLDLGPGQEVECWLALEAIRARHQTRSTPVLLCPVANWLIEGHEARIAQHGVYIWPEGFMLDDLLRTVELALASAHTTGASGGHVIG